MVEIGNCGLDLFKLVQRPTMYTIRISTDNAAFDDEATGDKRSETARILRELAIRLSQDRQECPILLRDVNGNEVGSCREIPEG